MADSSWSTTAASRWRAAITLYIGSSSSDSSREDRFRFVFEDVATECTTIQIRNAVGRTTITESAIMPDVVHMATKASTPNRSGMALVSLFRVAAESFGRDDLSCSAARTPASISTFSMLLSSATARRSTPPFIRHPIHALFWGRYRDC